MTMSDVEKKEEESNTENGETEIGVTKPFPTPYLNDIWQPPKRSQLKTIIWMVLAIATLLSGIFVSILGYQYSQTLTPESVYYPSRAMGTILDKQVFHYTTEGDTVIIKYTFTVGKKTFYDDYTYQYSPSGLSAGGQIEIAYVPSNPAANKPADDLDEYAGPWTYFIGWLLPFVGFSIFFGIKAWKSWRPTKSNPVHQFYWYSRHKKGITD
jgi:hypothetical protein